MAPGPPGWGLGMGLTTPSCKNHSVTETATDLNTRQTDQTGNFNQLAGNMTASDESPTREIRSLRRSLLRPKTNIRVGSWNVRTMYETSKTAQVTKEMDGYNLDILGISECRWTGSGTKTTSCGKLILYSGKQDHHSSGVAIIANKTSKKSLLEWEPTNDRILRARFDSKYCKLTVVQCYAPTNEAEEETKDEFYEQLNEVINKVPLHDMLIIMGDMNAKVGKDNTDLEEAIGQHGCGEINNNGERLVNFCLNNSCIIGGTIFPHKDIHKLTWCSPTGRTFNQIDHVIVNRKWRRSLMDVKVRRGADVNSDHYMVEAKIKLKLRATPPTKQRQKVFDVNKLYQTEIQKDFNIELKNRFSALAREECEDQETVEHMWESIKNAYTATAEKVIGFKRGKDKDWITPRTWKKIDERKEAKKRLLNTKSPRLLQRAQEEYKARDKEVKRSARKDKRGYVEDLATEAERAASMGQLSRVYKITNTLCGKAKNMSTAPIKNKEGQILTSDKEQTERWVQHFSEVLNRPEPENPIKDLPPDEPDININTAPPTIPEVEAAIRAMKNRKAPGIDALQAELLKTDLPTTSRILTNLFTKIWEEQVIPSDWSKGLIVKLPKKGDLSSCDNWRGITLLSIPSKIFCRILLKRIDSAIDKRLRQEQAGFRKGKGCIDQIFTLRNIIEQSLEWNAPLYVNFIDFKKAFDSVHRDSLWKIMRKYGIPEKITRLIEIFYEQFECSIIHNNALSQPFKVKSGVRQGCILSPILFLITIDWVMRQTTSDRPRGIQWTLFSQLEDLDFADDLAVLSTISKHLQEKTDRLNKFAADIGLQINSTKTQVMNINAPASTPITINEGDLKYVEDFTYLGSVISNDNGAHKDIKARLSKARGAFSRLRPIWKSRIYSLKTKLKLYNSNVKSVLLYGSECWRVIQSDMNKINAFHNSCLRRICNIFWPNKISNDNLFKKTRSQCISLDIKARRYRWLGHTFRMNPDSIPRTALKWTPTGKRKRGRPRTTWRRTISTELADMGISLGEAQALAQDRNKWRKFVAALCPTRDEED